MKAFRSQLSSTCDIFPTLAKELALGGSIGTRRGKREWLRGALDLRFGSLSTFFTRIMHQVVNLGHVCRSCYVKERLSRDAFR